MLNCQVNEVQRESITEGKPFTFINLSPLSLIQVSMGFLALSVYAVSLSIVPALTRAGKGKVPFSLIALVASHS